MELSWGLNKEETVVTPALGLQLASTQDQEGRLQPGTYTPFISTRQHLATAPGAVSARSLGPLEPRQQRRRLSGLMQAAPSTLGRRQAASPSWASQSQVASRHPALALPGEAPGRGGDWHQSALVRHNLAPGSLRLPHASGHCLRPCGLRQAEKRWALRAWTQGTKKQRLQLVQAELTLLSLPGGRGKRPHWPGPYVVCCPDSPSPELTMAGKRRPPVPGS